MMEAEHNAAATSVVGRDAQRAAVLALLGEARLVTLVGPAGVGKTHLAAAVALEARSAFPFGCAFVELGSVRPDFLVGAVATALGVAETSWQSLEQALRDRVSNNPYLLVMDNCGHMLEAVSGLVSRLLAGCPGLVVLATTSQRLGLMDERALAVPPLARSEAESLFVQRARKADTDIEVDVERVAEVCSRLGGMPLAIELAAARAGSLGLAGLQSSLGEPQRSVPDVLQWSYCLLNENERRLFRRLGVFVGAFDLEAVTWIGTDVDSGMVADLASRLADNSLLVADGEALGGRWRMLKAVRTHALNELAAAGEEPDGRRRHLEWAVATAAGLETVLDTDRSWRSRFDVAVDDLRAALDGASGCDVLAHQLARSLGHLCYARQFLLEARQRYQQAAACAPDGSAAAADLQSAAAVAMAEHRGQPAFLLLEAAAQRARSAGDGAAQAIALASAVCIASRFPAAFDDEVPHQQLRQMVEEARHVAPPDQSLVAAYLAAAEAWNATGVKTIPDQALARAAVHAARAANDPVLVMAALDAVIGGEGAAGRFRAAQRLSSERIERFHRLPRHDPRAGPELIDTLHMAPLVALAAGDLPHALDAGRLTWDDPFNGRYLQASKQVIPLMLRGRFDEALSFAAIMWDGWQQMGRPSARWMAPAVHAAALINGLRARADDYREWLSHAYALAAPRGQGHISDGFAAFADPRLALHAGSIEDAVASAINLPTMPPWYETTHHFFDAYAWATAAEVAVVAGLPDAGDWLAAASPAGTECAWAAACLLRARGRLHHDQDAMRQSLAGWDRIGARFERACTLVLLPDRARQGWLELGSLGCQSAATAAAVSAR
jgi:predicted ATPase